MLQNVCNTYISGNTHTEDSSKRIRYFQFQIKCKGVVIKERESKAQKEENEGEKEGAKKSE